MLVTGRGGAGVGHVYADTHLEKEKANGDRHCPVEHSRRSRDAGHQDTPEADNAAEASGEISKRRMERTQLETSLENYPLSQGFTVLSSQEAFMFERLSSLRSPRNPSHARPTWVSPTGDGCCRSCARSAVAFHGYRIRRLCVVGGPQTRGPTCSLHRRFEEHQRIRSRPDIGSTRRGLIPPVIGFETRQM